MVFFFFFNFYFIYLTVSGLGCGTRDLHYIMWDLWSRHTNSLVIWCGFSGRSKQELGLSEARGILFPQPEIELASPAPKGEFLTPGPAGKSHSLMFYFHFSGRTLSNTAQATCSVRIRTQIW